MFFLWTIKIKRSDSGERVSTPAKTVNEDHAVPPFNMVHTDVMRWNNVRIRYFPVGIMRKPGILYQE